MNKRKGVPKRMPGGKDFKDDVVNRLADFGRHLFSGTSSMEDEDRRLTQKELKAKTYFEQLQSTKEGRSNIYKEILSKGYVDFFVNGFSVKNIDGQFEHLSKLDKS